MRVKLVITGFMEIGDVNVFESDLTFNEMLKKGGVKLVDFAVTASDEETGEIIVEDKNLDINEFIGIEKA